MNNRPGYYLAQANIARLRYPLSDQRMAGMADRIAEMNRLAEVSPGFVWRFEGDALEGNNLSCFETYLQPFEEDRFFFNMSAVFVVPVLAARRAKTFAVPLAERLGREG